MLVPKQDGKVRMSVDDQDLDKASPKDDLPYQTLMSSWTNIARHVLSSFIDCFLGYNQIRMALEDCTKTLFVEYFLLQGHAL